jgi:hypothetical protein
MQSGLTALSDQPPFANAGQPFDVRALKAITSAGMAAPQMANIVGDLAKVQQASAVTGPNQVDIVDLPFGFKGASVRGSKDLKVLNQPVDPERMRTPDRIRLAAQRIELIKARALASDEDRALIDEELGQIDQQLGRPSKAAVTPKAEGNSPAGPTTTFIWENGKLVPNKAGKAKAKVDEGPGLHLPGGITINPQR